MKDTPVLILDVLTDKGEDGSLMIVAVPANDVRVDFVHMPPDVGVLATIHGIPFTLHVGEYSNSKIRLQRVYDLGGQLLKYYPLEPQGSSVVES